jgi:hypothetical protein
MQYSFDTCGTQRRTCDDVSVMAAQSACAFTYGVFTMMPCNRKVAGREVIMSANSAKLIELRRLS